MDNGYKQTSSCCDVWSTKKTFGSSSTSSSSSSGGGRMKHYSGDDAELAEELNNLTVEERGRVFDDIHGVATVQEETPKFVEHCIKELEKNLSGISHRKKKALNQAIFLNPKLEKNVDFKLMFLRADQYNPEKAARRMVEYFESKLFLFGEEKLVRRITIDDLSDEDLELIKCGCLVELPKKDRSGRPIFFFYPPNFDMNKNISTESVMRCFWYVATSSMLDDETAQKKGVCGVLHCSKMECTRENFLAKFTDVAMRCGKLVNDALPFRYTSYHVCYDDPGMGYMIQLLRVATGRQAMLRIRPHLGLLQNAAQGDTSCHEDYIRRRLQIDSNCREKEKQNSGSDHHTTVIPYPNPGDVLIGRGTPYQDYPGNILWRKEVDARLDRYLRTDSRFEKTCITIEVVKTLDATNRRFLQRALDGWEAVDDITAREKTAICFRGRAKVLAGNTKNSASRKHPSPDTDSSVKRPRIEN